MLTAKEKTSNTRRFFTKYLNKKSQVKDFNCEDKIILYFSWFDLKGNYSLKVNWYRPDGILQEITKTRFSVSTSKELNTALWLKLRKAKRLMPESGWQDFIGKWNAEIYLNSEFLSQKSFYVIC